MDYVAKAKTLRKDILTTLYHAGGSFSGGALSCADIITVLFHRFMRFDPTHPYAPDRDMFLLSKGHCSSALYAGLVAAGMFPREELKHYGADGSTLCIHPKKGSYPGVDISSGSLGHGLPQGTGSALAARIMGSDARVFVLMGDGECNEGSIWENAAFASRQNLDNLIVIVDRKIGQEESERLAKLFGYENIEVKEGVLNNLQLCFDNEPARHKLLDVIGDLALCGRFIKGHVIAERPGHKANASVAKMLYKEIVAEEKEDAYPWDIDLDAVPLMDINKIRSLLPHRPPFLLVDKVFKVTENMVVGCKNVTMNEPHFVGHFPEEPVMPGVLIVEAMSQCGGILVLSGVPDPENYSTYFMKIDGVKFRNKVVPGDTLVFKLITTAPIKRGVVQMKGFAYVGKKLVCEGEFMAQVAKTKNL